MALTPTNALVSIAALGGTPVPQVASGSVGLPSGSTIVFVLQSTTLVQRWEVSIASDDRTLDGIKLSWSPGQFNQLQLPTPSAPFIINYQSLVSDSQSSTAQIVGKVIGFVASPDNTIVATNFGAKGDCQLINSVFSGTDDTVALQAMLDANNTNTLPGPSQHQYVCKLNATQYQYNTGIVAPRTLYRTTRPLQKNDCVPPLLSGNTTTHFIGEPGANSGIYHREFIGPALVDGNDGSFTPSPVLDPNGSGEWLMQVGPSFSTTIAAGSNNSVLPQGTIQVASTAGFTTAGQFVLSSVTAAYLPLVITYTGISGNSFTGCTGGSGQVLKTSDQIITMTSPWWTLADCSLNDLHGFTAFTVEWFENPCNSTAWINANFPGAWISSPFGIGGTIGTTSSLVSSHETCAFLLQNGGSILSYTFRINIAGGSASVNTSTGADHTGAANTLHHIAVTYDGSHLRMFIDGAQPDGTMTTTASGAVAQLWYEAISYCSAGTVSWPATSLSPQWSNAPRLMGRIRISNIARYTAPFTAPLPSQIVNDANTRWYQDFSPSSIPTRPSLNAYNIGKSSANFYGISNLPVWLNNHTSGVSYTNGSQVYDMMFFGLGEAIHSYAALGAEFGRDSLVVANERGFAIDNFSYNTGVGKGCQFYQLGLPLTASNFISGEVVFGTGCQFSYINASWRSTFGSCNFAVISTNSDITIHAGFPNSYHQGFFSFTQNVSSVYLNSATFSDDQTTGVVLCGILLAPTHGQGARFKWSGGNLAMNAGTAPCMILGTSDVPVEIDTAIFAAAKNLVSFQGAGATTTVPVIVQGVETARVAAWADPSNPGPILAPEKELFGVKTMTPTGNVPLVVGVSGYTPTPTLGDQLYREYIIANGGWSGGQNVTWPSNPGKIYQVTNNNTQTATYKTLSGAAGQAATTGQKFKIQDQATGMVSI